MFRLTAAFFRDDDGIRDLFLRILLGFLYLFLILLDGIFFIFCHDRFGVRGLGIHFRFFLGQRLGVLLDFRWRRCFHGSLHRFHVGFRFGPAGDVGFLDAAYAFIRERLAHQRTFILAFGIARVIGFVPFAAFRRVFYFYHIRHLARHFALGFQKRRQERVAPQDTAVESQCQRHHQRPIRPIMHQLTSFISKIIPLPAEAPSFLSPRLPGIHASRRRLSKRQARG